MGTRCGPKFAYFREKEVGLIIFSCRLVAILADYSGVRMITCSSLQIPVVSSMPSNPMQRYVRNEGNGGRDTS